MMDDILKQIKAGEVSGVQFKERILDKYDIACEFNSSLKFEIKAKQFYAASQRVL
jgi:hypothetical protein